MPTIFSKGLINSIYKKMNITSKSRCKNQNPDDTTNRKICQSQAMADNARIMIGKLKAQKAGCNKTPNPDKCMKTIDELLLYLEEKQKEYQDDADQIKELDG